MVFGTICLKFQKYEKLYFRGGFKKKVLFLIDVPHKLYVL